MLNYMYFGLSCDATEKDLDNAYRKLAKQMHPDKNGGTEEAKKKFQNMKERYEALKKKRGEHTADEAAGKKQKDERDAADDIDEGDKERESDNGKNRQRLQLEDGEKPPGDKGGDSDREDEADEEDKQPKSTSIEYDPTDKDSMLKAVSKMVKQLKNIQIQMKVVMKELHRAQTQVPQHHQAPQQQ